MIASAQLLPSKHVAAILSVPAAPSKHEAALAIEPMVPGRARAPVAFSKLARAKSEERCCQSDLRPSILNSLLLDATVHKYNE